MEQAVFTQNTHYLQFYKDKFIGLYKGSQDMKEKCLDEDEHNALLQLASLVGVTGSAQELLDRLKDPDPHQGQIDLMAEVRAFWQVAYKVSI